MRDGDGQILAEPIQLGPDHLVALQGQRHSLLKIDSPFEPFAATMLPNPQTLERDGLVAFYASMGWLGDLPDNERLPLLNEVRALLTAAEYQRAWETHVHWTRRHK